MEIRRNYEQLNTRAKPEVSNLAKKKPKTIKKDVIAQLQLKDKPGKIKLGQVGREHILVLLHTRVGLVCKTVLVGQRWGRGRWPMSPPQQSMSSTGDTRPRSPFGDTELMADIGDGHSPLCHLGVLRDGSPSASPRPLVLHPHPGTIPARRRPSSAGATVPAAWRVAVTCFLPPALMSKLKELKSFEPSVS